jgi:hypothetical protein
MIYILTALIVCCCIALFMLSRWKRNPTMFDVRHLLVEGKREEAIHLYIHIFPVSKKEAEKAVEELERGIQQKNFEIE